MVMLENLESVFIPRTKKLTFWIILEGNWKCQPLNIGRNTYFKLLVLSILGIYQNFQQQLTDERCLHAN